MSKVRSFPPVGMQGAGQARSEVENYKNILVVRLDRMGDVVLSTPALKALRDAYPDSRITFMVRPYVKDIAQGNPSVNEVIIYDKGRGFLENLEFIRRLRNKKFDLAVVLHPTFRTNWIVFLSGIPKRLGFDRKRKMGILLTDKIPDMKHLGLKHEIDYTLDILRYIGVNVKDRKMHVPVNQDSQARSREALERGGISENDTVVVINPGASCPSKRWPAKKFAEAADMLVKSRGVKIVIISGKEDKGFGEKVAFSMKESCLDLSGKTTVGDIAGILKRAKLFISNDSGPVHVACAIGTPVVAIFGRCDRGLSPRRWGPSNNGDVVIHKDVGCLECLAHNCALGFRCLQAITVNEVVKAAEELLR
ncbi:MAG: lipopolysaccharide heptosyltransferase II [Candidatus Omnitrophica bacterium]|nr:lipopolysaccharide heptosyltransferase II [Candidatus Omnitrophota bacterium]